MELKEAPNSEPPATPGVGAQLRSIWAKASRTQRLMLGGAALAFVVGSAVLMSPDVGDRHAVLFSGLSAPDAGRVIEQLQSQKIPYRVEGNGSVITVPEANVHETRINLAASGLPNGSVGFELFDEQNFGTTSFVEQLNFRRALEGELSRTIGALENVDRARVHISMGERSLYRNEDKPPSASVMVALRGNERLKPDQAKAIVNLVSASVAGMEAERVTVVDQEGNTVSTQADEEGSVEQQGELELTLARRVERILEPVVGAGHVAVSVTAQVDTSQTERTEEIYEQNPENVALRSESRTVEGAGATALPAGVAGAKGNLPGAPAPQTNEGGGDVTRLTESKNYEVNRVVSRTVGPKAKLRRLHVAVLVDATTDEEGNSVARSEGELASIAKLATEAAGIDVDRGDRIEVHSVPFFVDKSLADDLMAEEPQFPLPVPMEVAVGAAAAVPVFGFIGFALWRRRRKAKKKKSQALVRTVPVTVRQLEQEIQQTREANPALAAPKELAGADAPYRAALEAAKGDAKTTARIVGGWLAEPAEKGATA